MRRLRYALRCDDAQTVKMINLGGGRATTAQAAAWRVKETEPEYTPCKAETLVCFLDGLILDRRGPKEAPAANPWPDRSKSKQVELSDASLKAAETKSGSEDDGDSTPNANAEPQMDNNIVLKQLRIALSLRSDSVHAILKAGGSAMSETEASALFRKPGARNYRQCGDQVLRQFIAGLVEQRQKQGEE